MHPNHSKPFQAFLMEILNFSHQGCHFRGKKLVVNISWIAHNPQKIWGGGGGASDLNSMKSFMSDRLTDRQTDGETEKQTVSAYNYCDHM